MLNRPFLNIGLLCLSLVLAACSNTEKRKDYAELAQQELDSTSKTKTSQWQTMDNVVPASYLTDLIQDEQLNSLITQALEANPSLQKTQLTLQASLWSLKSQQGDSLPSVEAGFSGNKSEGSDTDYKASLSISWEADLWQKLAQAEQASAKTLASDEALYQASRDTLVANVVKTWLAITAKQHAIDIEQKRLKLLEANEQLILKRFKNGLGNLEELDESRTSTSQSKADLVEYKENLAIEIRNLQLYLGKTDSLSFITNQNYPDVSLTLSDLPQQNLQRRPDLKAAYLTIEAADLNTSVAYKDMLPSISLSATLSETAASPRAALFGSPIWSLLAQITQPLYQGGQLKAAAEIAKLKTAQAYQDYRDTLLTAVNEVENTLGQERVLSQQVRHINEALFSAKKNLTQYEKKYRTGLVELNDLINAQTTAFDLEAQLDNLIYQHLSNRVDLGLALGLGVKP
ncbi:MAG: TolC family protein [Gammaproteobacteria bacterium]|uniref:TolC family protein n=1 Tax=Marinomonas TaxID=28253 RepID=UPI000C1EEC59|nr:TolC family protein [Marinomonas sp. BSi20584]MBU1293849.1 TolC family protein [Gammaproteobacteria bacterium]MBU2021583.1 TolC family protein [Gammaproteobacteria bacterium]MBU2239028.1 TolC family protein [Gammaproteobacteria bacterium]MBU2319498.1 TolC family protein [Gammaproteobacteria bacterium]MBU2415092.1 TolC family protein [Gammaproteobacteria bacterium]|tara:strand:- start:39018 stop:40394 length:1377 start_codon:yes stop_codon:yes gene_type:complete